MDVPLSIPQLKKFSGFVRAVQHSGFPTEAAMGPDGRTTGAKFRISVCYGSFGSPESGVFTGTAIPMNFVTVLLP